MTRRILSSWAAALGVSTGCVGSDAWSPETLPVEVDWVAVVVEGSGVEPVISGLHNPDNLAAAIPVDRSVRLIGYGAEQIAQLSPPDVLELRTTPLELAQGCEPSLPDPIWQGKLDEDRKAFEIDRSPPPRLTVSWLTTCPTFPTEDLLVEPSHKACPLVWCAPQVLQEGCRLLLQPTCGVEPMEGTVDSQGRLCVQGENENQCYTRSGADVPDPHWATLDCPGGCEVGLRFLPPQAPFFRAETKRVLEVERLDPRALDSGFEELEKQSLRFSYVDDLLPLDDRIVMTGPFGGSRHPMCSGSGRFSQLHFLDPDSMEVTGTATVPRGCLQRLSVDPWGGGFVASHVERDVAFSVIRFDRDNRERTRARLAPVEGVVAQSGLIPLEAPPGFVLVLMRAAHEGVGVYFAHPDLSELRLVSEIGRAETVSAIKVGPSSIAFANEQRDSVSVLDFSTPEPTWSHLESYLVRDSRVGFLAYLPALDAILMPTLVPRAIEVYQGLGRSRSGVFAENAQKPHMAHPWPLDSKLALVVQTTDDDAADFESSVALYDAETAAYVTHVEPLGRGPVSRIRTDSQGRLWLLFPWTAEVVRLAPLRAP